MRPDRHQPGVGPTAELSLRVSVAALVAVLFDSPEDGRAMLALERTATLREIEGRPEVTVTAKPFGGGVRLTDPEALRGIIGDYRYDSERSRQEGDFRLQLKPASWPKLQEVCRDQLHETERRILDPSPQRELAEEFEDALRVRLTPDRYRLTPRGMVVEDVPRATNSVRAAGRPTVRIYYVFEARIDDAETIRAMLANSGRYSDRDLQDMARRDARSGGKGRSNAVLAVALDDLKALFRRRGGPLRIGEHQLEGNVAAVLRNIPGT